MIEIRGGGIRNEIKKGKRKRDETRKKPKRKREIGEETGQRNTKRGNEIGRRWRFIEGKVRRGFEENPEVQ